MARMPSCDDGVRMFMIAREGEHRRVGGGQKEDRDEDQARGRAQFRPAHEAGQRTRRVLEALVLAGCARCTARGGRLDRLFEMRHARLHPIAGGKQPASRITRAASASRCLANALGGQVDDLRGLLLGDQVRAGRHVAAGDRGRIWR